MNLSKVDYPYPVLTTDGMDYEKSCYFKVNEIKKEDLDISVKVTVSYDLRCEPIEQLLLENKAKVILYVESSSTSFRDLVQFPGGQRTVSFEVQFSDLSKILTIRPEIISITDFDFYSPSFNKDFFEGIHFMIHRGDILATERQYDIPLREEDPLKAHKSIFSIRTDEDIDNSIRVDLDDPNDKINIFLDKHSRNLYEEIKGHSEYKLLLSSVLVLPALVEAIEKMKMPESAEAYGAKRWYKVLEKRIQLKHLDIERDSTLTIANDLLGKMMIRVFEELSTKINNDERAREADE